MKCLDISQLNDAKDHKSLDKLFDGGFLSLVNSWWFTITICFLNIIMNEFISDSTFPISSSSVLFDPKMEAVSACISQQ